VANIILAFLLHQQPKRRAGERGKKRERERERGSQGEVSRR
jgi:hypothetical protein